MEGRGRTKDKTLSKLGSRLITTMLKTEKLADKELEEKMKALKVSERKSMVKICETSLEVKYDYRRKRNTQIMEEECVDDHFGVTLDQERVTRSPSFSRRGSFAPATENRLAKEKEKQSPCPNQEPSKEGNYNPTILINNKREESDLDKNSDACSTPPNELTDDEVDAEKLKVFSQSAESHRRRTVPELAVLSPKLLIQLAKSSAEIKRRGSIHDASAAASEEEWPEEVSLPLPNREESAATGEPLQTKSQDISQSSRKNLENNPLSSQSPTSAGSFYDQGFHSPTVLRRRGSSSITNAKIPSSLEFNQTLIRDKASDKVHLSHRLKAPTMLSPLLSKTSSEVVTTHRQRTKKGLASDPGCEGFSSFGKLPDLNVTKKPSPSSFRRSLGPLPAVSSLDRSARLLPTEFQDLVYSPDSTRSCQSRAPTNPSPEVLSNRRVSQLLQVDFNSLAPTSPLRKAMEDPKSTLNPAPVSPRMLRRHSGTVEDLQDRVNDFLKTFSTKKG